MNKHLLQNKRGFTLAEVLITLLIIGVVASLVIPSIINDTNKAEYVTKLKKEYAILQQAYKLLIIDNGGSILNDPNFNCSGTCNGSKSANAMNEFAEKLSVTKNCGTGTGCWYSSTQIFIGGDIVTSNLESSWSGVYGKAVLADGTSIAININNTNCTRTYGSTTVGSPTYQSICGIMDIDINGSIKPNQLGRDNFSFYITKYGIYPKGVYNDGSTCNPEATSSGYGCSGNVLSKGEMTY
jgi:prepilin-type N-terminal cleavage/methylation domain-containing protein